MDLSIKKKKSDLSISAHGFTHITELTTWHTRELEPFFCNNTETCLKNTGIATNSYSET